MVRFGIFAILLCSQLAAPALSGKFVCFGPNGCICIDSGPRTCTCSHVRSKAPMATCACGCHEEQPPQGFELGDQGCTHLAIGDYPPPLKAPTPIHAASPALSGWLALCRPPASAPSLSDRLPVLDGSGTLAVIATVVLRI